MLLFEYYGRPCHNLDNMCTYEFMSTTASCYTYVTHPFDFTGKRVEQEFQKPSYKFTRTKNLILVQNKL